MRKFKVGQFSPCSFCPPASLLRASEIPGACVVSVQSGWCWVFATFSGIHEKVSIFWWSGVRIPLDSFCSLLREGGRRLQIHWSSSSYGLRSPEYMGKSKCLLEGTSRMGKLRGLHRDLPFSTCPICCYPDVPPAVAVGSLVCRDFPGPLRHTSSLLLDSQAFPAFLKSPPPKLGMWCRTGFL